MDQCPVCDQPLDPSETVLCVLCEEYVCSGCADEFDDPVPYDSGRKVAYFCHDCLAGIP
jgi:hypothetical protein